MNAFNTTNPQRTSSWLLLLCSMAHRVSLFALLVLLLACHYDTSVFAASDLIMPAPSVSNGRPVAVIMLQGAGIEAATYKPLLSAIQNQAAAAMSASASTSTSKGTVTSPATTKTASPPPLSLWAAAPQYPLSTVNPAVIDSGITRVISALTKAGMNASDTPIFLFGHSLGGAMLDLYVHGKPTPYAGALFGGAFIARSRRNKLTGATSYPLPTHTIAATLDGLARVTRVGAEAYYAQVELAENKTQAAIDMGVSIVKGMSHMQFASGQPPALVRARDLRPEISYDDAHKAVAAIAMAFIRGTVYKTLPAAQADLIATARRTEVFVEPMVQAALFEGSNHYGAVACNSDFPTNPDCQYGIYPGKALIPGTYPRPPSPPLPSNCKCGSPWVRERAMAIMAGFNESSRPDVTVQGSDAFHDVSDVRPFHLAHIFNNCSGVKGCKINATSVDMLVYEALDAEDTGFVSVSALEMRVKLKSRQAFWQSAGIWNANYTQTDLNETRCAAINQAAYDWAKSRASKTSLDRFAKLGEEYVMGQDVKSPIGITGPTWIGKSLQYNRSVDEKTGKSVMVVRSPYFAGKNIVPEPGYLHPCGYHYCKLLSPARALEWILVDGLRHYGSLNNNTSLENTL